MHNILEADPRSDNLLLSSAYPNDLADKKDLANGV
jgi:hypothetical protein